MRLITLARILLWTACICGILVFFVEYEPAQKKFLALINSFWKDSINSKNFKEYKDYFDIIQGISAVLVGIGSFIAREYHNVEKKLNRHWFWASRMEQDGKILRVGWGEMTIKGIQNFKKRRDEAGMVLQGKVLGDSGHVKADGSMFYATEIVVGQRSSQLLFYEWEYQDGANVYARGVTKLKYYKEWQTVWWFFKHTVLRMNGQFMLDTSRGGASIEFYRNEEEARYEYDEAQKRLDEQSKEAIQHDEKNAEGVQLSVC